ncbi:MAG: zf-TFIIB domain-containing protein [Planctomycetota bacterium]
MMCLKCGNEITDSRSCQICETTEIRPKKRNTVVVSLPMCPQCAVPVEQQDWEGVVALQCPDCRGVFFPERGLEHTLNKLRAATDPKDVDSVMQDFKDRFRRTLPDTVRYKNCPVCETSMMRKNYGTVSGVVVDVCATHGTWVDEPSFAALADFVCRGGDLLSRRVENLNTSMSAKQTSGPSLLNRMFGAR